MNPFQTMEPPVLVPCLPETAPFSERQRAWLNGFLAGLFSARPSAAVPASLLEAVRPPDPGPLTILYGTQSGTAEALARKAASRAKQLGFTSRVAAMPEYDAAELPRAGRLLVLVSTHGDGEMPDGAHDFWRFLSGDRAPRLEGVAFSVLALGDSSYAKFCAAGKAFDRRLEELGARRLHPRADCDVDFDVPFATWIDGVLQSLREPASGDGAGVVPGAAAASPVTTRQPEPGDGVAGREADTYVTVHPAGTARPVPSRTRPFAAPVRERVLLNGPGSERETYHVALSIEGAGMAYEPGDALGVRPANCPELVEAVVHALRCDAETRVETAEGPASLRAALARCELRKLHRPLLTAFGARPGAEALARLAEADPDGFDRYATGRDVLDLLLGHPAVRWDPQQFVSNLRALQPRLYSISSAPTRFPGEVHLTVSAVRYETAGRACKGVCSTYLSDRVPDDGTVPVYVHPNPHFRLPADGDAPLVMIGPGTGVAPFRAFLQAREDQGAKGPNWLFFGAPRSRTDFLYGDELEAMTRSGLLTRLDTAFSRDQAQKCYVQHRMLEHAADLFGWLEDGACVYVCGDAAHMAKDVDRALHAVIERSGRTADEAAAYVEHLRRTGRYRRDVY